MASHCSVGYNSCFPSWYGTVRYGTVRYGTVRYGTVRYGTVRYGTVRYGTVRYGTVRYGMTLCYVLECSHYSSHSCRVVSVSNVDSEKEIGIKLSGIVYFLD